MDKNLFKAQENIIGNRIGSRRFLGSIFFLLKREVQERAVFFFCWMPLCLDLMPGTHCRGKYAKWSIFWCQKAHFLDPLETDICWPICWLQGILPDMLKRSQPKRWFPKQSRIVQFLPISTGGRYVTTDIGCDGPVSVNGNHLQPIIISPYSTKLLNVQLIQGLGVWTKKTGEISMTLLPALYSPCIAWRSQLCWYISHHTNVWLTQAQCKCSSWDGMYYSATICKGYYNPGLRDYFRLWNAKWLIIQKIVNCLFTCFTTFMCNF